MFSYSIHSPYFSILEVFVSILERIRLPSSSKVFVGLSIKSAFSITSSNVSKTGTNSKLELG